MAMIKGGTRTMRPTQMKILSGADKNHPERFNKREPKTRRGIPPAPPYLLDSEKEAWERFAESLDGQMHVLTKDDFAAFEALVCTYDECRRLRQALRDDPELILREPKFNKQHEHVGDILKIRPEFSALNAADTRLGQWLGRFGLTPGDRARVKDLEENGEPSAKTNPDKEFGAA